jgi:hypothetical protein
VLPNSHSVSLTVLSVPKAVVDAVWTRFCCRGGAGARRCTAFYDGFADVSPPADLMQRIDYLIDAVRCRSCVAAMPVPVTSTNRWNFGVSAVAAALALALVGSQRIAPRFPPILTWQ